MRRRSFLASILFVLSPAIAIAHSPWGQYAVYRKKHLLVLSTRDDEGTYPFSKLLVNAINNTAPEAKARPARAKDLNRAYDLLRTDQFQFALLSRTNVNAMRSATGPYSGGERVDLKTIYCFEELEFVVRADFPANLVAIVTHAVLSNLETLPGALAPSEVLGYVTLHSGAREAVEEFKAHYTKGR